MVARSARPRGRDPVVRPAEGSLRSVEPAEYLDALRDPLEWAEQQAHLVLDALDTADPDSSCWTFGEPRSRRFWFRRQALETAVHAWDVQQAVARPGPIAPELAIDGIDEFLTLMLPRQLKQQPGG